MCSLISSRCNSKLLGVGGWFNNNWQKFEMKFCVVGGIRRKNLKNCFWAGHDFFFRIPFCHNYTLEMSMSFSTSVYIMIYFVKTTAFLAVCIPKFDIV